MSNSSENILTDLEDLLSVTETERYEKFLAVIDKYGYLHKHSIQSVNEFDKVHNDLLNLLLLNKECGPRVDLSIFDQFQSFMKNLRRLIETLVIQHCIQVEKLDILDITVKRLEGEIKDLKDETKDLNDEIKDLKNETKDLNDEIKDLKDEMKDLKDETKDLKELLYEKEFNKLTFAVSTPLKNALSKRFRTEEIRMDPLDEDLLVGLFTNKCPRSISKEKFSDIVDIYKDMAGTIGIDYKQVVEIIHCRQQRNAEQHELMAQYIRRCKQSGMKSEFSSLLEHLHLTRLYKYKKSEMKMLEKVFDFYVSRDEYR